MATRFSCDTMKQIIEQLGEKYNFGRDDALAYLTHRTDTILPKKLQISSEKKKSGDEAVFASKQAREYAEQHHFVPVGKGGGKDGKWTKKDIEDAVRARTGSIFISDAARKLIDESDIVLPANFTGTGKDGMVKESDVKKYIKSIKSSGPSDSVDMLTRITDKALELAKQNKLSDATILAIPGTTKTGKISINDVKDFLKKREEREEEPSDEEPSDEEQSDGDDQDSDED
tara:strand:+ start:118 stop:807 length:690 start_codon:yes stop_codon:yes gene_type:complete